MQLELFREKDAVELLKGILEEEDIKAIKAFFKNATPFPGFPQEMWQEIKTYVGQLPAEKGE